MMSSPSVSFDGSVSEGSISLPLHPSHSFSSTHNQLNSSQHEPATMHGDGRPSFPLLSIVFAEFDNTVGPKITCQSPPGFLSDDLFDSISDFIITGVELCHKLVTVTVAQYTIIGYPMQLSHKKYHRNALLFNVCFVFSSSIPPILLRPYHSVIRKLANMLENLELESEFLFRGRIPTIPAVPSYSSSLNQHNQHQSPSPTSPLQQVITKIFRSLNAYGECSVAVEVGGKEKAEKKLMEEMQQTIANAAQQQAASSSSSSSIQAASSSSSTAASSALRRAPPLPSPPHSSSHHSHHTSAASSEPDPSNKIHLKLYPLLTLPPKSIPSYSVPVRIKDLDDLWKVEWDLTLRQIIPFIDGVNYVSRISILSGVHQTLVSKCIRQLLYYEAIMLCDIFQYENIYTCCDGMTQAATLPEDASINEKARLVHLRNSARKICRYTTSQPKPAFSTLWRIWTAMTKEKTLSEILRSLDKILPDVKESVQMQIQQQQHDMQHQQYLHSNGRMRSSTENSANNGVPSRKSSGGGGASGSLANGGFHHYSANDLAYLNQHPSHVRNASDSSQRGAGITISNADLNRIGSETNLVNTMMNASTPSFEPQQAAAASTYTLTSASFSLSRPASRPPSSSSHHPQFSTITTGSGNALHPSLPSTSFPPFTLTLEHLNIHPRKFIQFGLINGLIRRVHGYPILISNVLTMSGGVVGNVNAAIMNGNVSGDLVNGAASSTSNSVSVIPPSILPPLTSLSPHDLFSGLIHGAGGATTITRENTAAGVGGTQGGLKAMLDQQSSSKRTQQSGGGKRDRSSAGFEHNTSDRVLDSLSSSSHQQPSRSRQVTDDRDRSGSSLSHHPNASSTSLLLVQHASSTIDSSEQPASATATSTAPPPQPPPLSALTAYGSSSSSSSSSASFRALERYLDGEHPFDQICCITQRSFQSIDDEIRRSKKCIVIWK